MKLVRSEPLEDSQQYLIQFRIDKTMDSVVLIKNSKYYLKSTASFRILKTLGGFRSICYGFIIIPAFIRDFFYDIMAGLRYKLFGQKTCELPQNLNFKDKFL